MDSKSQLTTEAGIPVGDNQNSLTASPRGPGVLSAWHLFIVPTMKPNLAPV
jgi:catalase